MSLGKRQIIFDIGSGSVGAAVVETARNRPPHIEYIKRLPLPVKEKVKSGALIASTLEAIGEIAADILAEKKSAHEVMLILASPWYVSQTKNASQEKKEPFKISQRTIDEIVERESQGVSDGDSGEKLTVIEKNVAQIKLNGYPTSAPFGISARKLELSLYLSSAPTEFLLKIEEALHQQFSVRHISHHTFPFVVFGALKNIFPTDRNFIYLDIAGEITDILAVGGGDIVGAASFPVGKNHLVRKVIDKFSVTPEIAVSYIKLVSEERAGESLEKQIAELSGAVREEWRAYFEQITSDIFGKLARPQKIFLTADEDVGELFLEYIPESFSSKVLLSGESLSGFYTTSEHLPHDPFLALESIYKQSFVL